MLNQRIFIIIALFVITFVVGFATSSLIAVRGSSTTTTTEEDNSRRQKDVIVLIHGAWHTKDIWDSTVTKLKRDYRVEDISLVQLPGRVSGENTCAVPIPPQNYGPEAGYYASFNLTTFVQTIENVVSAKQHLGRIHIVAHSLSGAYVQHTLSVMDSVLRSRVETVVFVASYLTAPGKSALDYTTNSTLLLANLIRPFPTAPMLCVNTTQVAEIFYGTCRPSLQIHAAANLVYEPIIPIVTPLANTLKDLDIKQVYIKTLLDRAIPPSSQAVMIREQRQLGNRRLSVVDMISDHTPQYCTSSVFARKLGAILHLRLKFY
jgi:pimeloyl-ACP methyl ester carboxylesterase